MGSLAELATRTPDLLGAIQALSQLSYSPWMRSRPRGEGRAGSRGRWGRTGRAVPRDGDLHDPSNARSPIRSEGHDLVTRMSFRNRLTLFFVVIVIVPMISVALVLFRLIADSENGQADAGVRARIELVHNLYLRDVARADRVLRRVVADAGLARALTQGDVRALTRRLGRLAISFGARRAVLTRAGRVLVDVGDRGAVAPASQALVGPGGRSLGQLELSTVDGRRARRRGEAGGGGRRVDRTLRGRLRGDARTRPARTPAHARPPDGRRPRLPRRVLRHGRVQRRAGEDLDPV